MDYFYVFLFLEETQQMTAAEAKIISEVKRKEILLSAQKESMKIVVMEAERGMKKAQVQLDEQEIQITNDLIKYFKDLGYCVRCQSGILMIFW